jgi:hypothetical protein
MAALVADALPKGKLNKAAIPPTYNLNFNLNWKEIPNLGVGSAQQRRSVVSKVRSVLRGYQVPPSSRQLGDVLAMLGISQWQ